MISFSLDFVLASVKGKLLSRHQEIFEGLGSDTRKPLNHQLFIALKGDAFDAHQFLAAATQQGAGALVIHDESKITTELLERVTIIKVENTLTALQSLARAYRRKNIGKIVGIAGSNGKTTSKEFCAALLGATRTIHYSKGSFNNHWGVPLTLLAQPEDAQIAVVEMGMNHAGELALLAEVAEPDICVCTYVGVEHIEHFGSLEKIAEAEEEIYLHSPPQAVRIFNLDNLYTREMKAHSQNKFPQSMTLTFSETAKADVNLHIKEVTMESLTVAGQIGGISGLVSVPVFGKHNITNLMVAATVGLACELSPQQIWNALPLCRTTWGRNQLIATDSGAQILFDGYNSNPDSMKALVENMSLVKTSGKKVGIFAEMRELGDLAPQLHQETGEAVGHSPLDLVWFYGAHAEDFARGLRRAHFRGEIIIHVDFDSATSKKIAGELRAGDIAIVKGSRGMALERFVLDSKPLDFTTKV